MNKFVQTRVSGFLAVGAVVATALISADHAYAASCNAKASSLASSQGGSVLSVRASGGKCVIKLLIKSPSGPPKRKTFVVNQ